MTVSYNSSVSTSSLWNVQRLLLRWRGSVWQCVWHELLLWMMFYTILSASYRYAMDPDQRVIFEQTTIYCNKYSGWIPVTFLLGFYVSFIVGRWWNVFSNISFPDEFALALSSMINDRGEKARRVRRTTTRFLVLAQVLALRQISTAVFKRFPTYDHLLNAGLLNQDELDHVNRIPVSENHRWWIPIRWNMRLLANAIDEGMIKTEVQLLALITRVDDFRQKNHRLLCYDWISIPLVYTQVVNLAVRSYLIVCLMGRQFLDIGQTENSAHEVDLYVPLFTILQFICFGGWLKVAEVLINPMGEDDEDFDLNYIIDRNLKYGLTIIDDGDDSLPNLTRDMFWSTDVPVLNHTVASAELKINAQQPSTNTVHVSRRDAKIVPNSTSASSSRTGSRMGSIASSIQKKKSVFSKILKPDTTIPNELKRTVRQRSFLGTKILTNRLKFNIQKKIERKRSYSEGDQIVMPEVVASTTSKRSSQKLSMASKQKMYHHTVLSRVNEEDDVELKQNSDEDIDDITKIDNK